MIPHTIHRVWLGGAEPDWLAAFAATWERPGWEIRQWSDDNVGELFPLRNQAIFDEAPEIAPDHVGQLRSDVLRLEILDRFGGVYVDADFECIRPIDDLLDGIDCFAAWESQDRWIGNTVLGAVSGHPFVDALIARLPGNVRRRRGSRPNKLSGPQYVTRVYRAEFEGSVTVFPQGLFYPYGWHEVADVNPAGARDQFPGAYAVHHWFNKRGRPACV